MLCDEKNKKIYPQQGFSLVELLITLAILGVLSTFAISQMFNVPASSLSSKQTALTRDTAYMIMAAFERYRAEHPDVSTMRSADLTPYMNYVKEDTSGTFDNIPGTSYFNCSSSQLCLHLHNGGVLYMWSDGFCASGSNPTGVPYGFAPDTSNSGSSADGPSKAIRLFIYSDGTIRTKGTLQTDTQWSSTPGTTCNLTRSGSPTDDPSWFSGF